MSPLKTKLKRNDLVYPALSYQIIGILFDVFNTLGFGYQEKHYQKALSIALKKAGLCFKEQIHIPLHYKTEKIGNYYLDFLIEEKIVLEIKKGNYFLKSNIDQIYSYLKATELKLGILANFTEKGVKYKRILNIK
jgi:GxxExxY protein